MMCNLTLKILKDLDLNLPCARGNHNFYGDLVYKIEKIVGSNNFTAQFIKMISHNKKIGIR